MQEEWERFQICISLENHLSFDNFNCAEVRNHRHKHIRLRSCCHKLCRRPWPQPLPFILIQKDISSTVFKRTLQPKLRGFSVQPPRKKLLPLNLIIPFKIYSTTSLLALQNLTCELAMSSSPLIQHICGLNRETKAFRDKGSLSHGPKRPNYSVHGPSRQLYGLGCACATCMRIVCSRCF